MLFKEDFDKTFTTHERICQFFLVRSPGYFIHNERVPSSNSRRYAYLLDHRFLCIRRNCHKLDEKREIKRVCSYPSTIYHSRYPICFLKYDFAWLDARSCAHMFTRQFKYLHICIATVPTVSHIPRDPQRVDWRGIDRRVRMCLISMEGRWSLKRFAIPNLRVW